MAEFESIPSSETLESVTAALGIAGRFGLRQIVALSQFESFGNENWMLEMRDGRRVVLRRYLHSNRERLAFQIELQRRLHAAGFPVARHLPNAAAEETELGEDGVTWAAFEHIEGREYNFSIEDAVQAARRLGEFHVFGRDLAGIAPPLVQRPSIRDCWLNAETDLEGLRELFADVAVQDELQYLEDWWRFVGREWPLERFDALPSGLVHGDFHGRNTAYAGGELVGIFDFDDVEPAPFVHDLAGSAYKFGRESRFVLTPRADVVHAFIETYATIRPLSAEERAALPVMMAMSYPPNPRYYAYYRNHHGSNLVNRLHREVGVMRMLRGEAASIFGASFS